MANLYPNYPYGCTEKDISKAIKEYSDEIIASRADINKVLQFTPLIALGQGELQSRQTRRITRLSLGLGFLSLIIAGAALLVSFMNTRSDEAWQKHQLELLNAIQTDINVQGKAILEEVKRLERPAVSNVARPQSNKALQLTAR